MVLVDTLVLSAENMVLSANTLELLLINMALSADSMVLFFQLIPWWYHLITMRCQLET
jgi:hypothetical protein